VKVKKATSNDTAAKTSLKVQNSDSFVSFFIEEKEMMKLKSNELNEENKNKDHMNER
jgi:hypothetical protein